LGYDPDFPTKKAIKPAKEMSSDEILSLALNIPTLINLYAYGYRNVYELAEVIDVNDPRVIIEGVAIGKR
jgi:hypothetical protein